ncbi:menaquinone-dependent protoporphyrinogen oxidase [Halogranum amylolyticum]|uniref:Menaquinone-dependent protoporphyrinogen oxidase n=1 Tax=Halogranum amylolyticum TaxID=660520 RepID=A0A1H8UJY1_9EURY|nr:flavodoxin domain-containing protein [Halogranum amylolyticum]SEP03550.1 menaquinone-dependent protoporphyrinogen oxidase [Halogranum amylolyticum]
MSSVLVLYGTGEGQTAKIAERITTTISERGHEASALDVRNRPESFTLEGYDAVVVGASIHVGKHQDEVRDFVTDNRNTLSGMPTAFFQVSLSSANEEKREEAAGYVESFLTETGWDPDRIGQFGGALRFSEYGFLKRLMMKRIAKDLLTEEREQDGDIEFTDWDAVDAFAADVAAFVENRLGVTPDTTEDSSE